jgi:hypothetical protein
MEPKCRFLLWTGTTEMANLIGSRVTGLAEFLPVGRFLNFGRFLIKFLQQPETA